MTHTTLPVEGWVERCASYGLTIVRSVVTELRDNGPLDAVRVRSIIKRAGVGEDVRKASPIHVEDDGAARILNFLTQDIAEIVCVDDTYSVDPDITRVTSNSGFTVNIASVEDNARNAETNFRTTQLRRWATTRPFQGEWSQGLRQHTEDELRQMTEYIQAVGYVGHPIVRDQNGMIIDGHLRTAALVKLGIDPNKHSTTVHFVSDYHRLGWILAAHLQDGRWPNSIRDAVKKVVNHSMARSGVKMNWPADVSLIAPMAEVPKVPAIVPVKPKVNVAQRPLLKPGSKMHRYASWLRDHPGHTGTQVIKAVLGNRQSGGGGSLSRWKELGLVEECGSLNNGGILIRLTPAGLKVLEEADAALGIATPATLPSPPLPPSLPPPPSPPTFRCLFRNETGAYSTGKPGGEMRSEPRTAIVRQLIAASERGEWTPKADFAGGSLKLEGIFRRWMWFTYDHDGYLFIPDTLQRNWKMGKVRRLTYEECKQLTMALDTSDEALYEMWEGLVRAEY